MKIVLRNYKTGTYFQTTESWTKLPENARDFEGSREAILTCFQLGLRDVEVVWLFGNRAYDFSWRLGDGR